MSGTDTTRRRVLTVEGGATVVALAGWSANDDSMEGSRTIDPAETPQASAEPIDFDHGPLTNGDPVEDRFDDTDVRRGDEGDPPLWTVTVYDNADFEDGSDLESATAPTVLATDTATGDCLIVSAGTE